MVEVNTVESRIKKSMVELIQVKPFSKITINNIIKHAHINRSTFYYYFSDKFKLRDSIIQDMTENLDKSIPLRNMPHESSAAEKIIHAPMIEQSISYMHKEKELFMNLNNPNWEYDMYQLVCKHFERVALEWCKDQRNKGYDQHLFAKLYAVCAVTTVIWSFENNVDEETVSKIISSHMHRGFYLAFTDPGNLIERIVKKQNSAKII